MHGQPVLAYNVHHKVVHSHRQFVKFSICNGMEELQQ